MTTPFTLLKPHFQFPKPYWEDWITGAFCVVVIIVAAVRKESFEARPLGQLSADSAENHCIWARIFGP